MEGTKYWGFDEAFTSMSYCCVPGGGYFRNDEAEKNFDQFAVFMEFRESDKTGNRAIQVSQDKIDEFLNNPDNFHLLDGFTVNGPNSDLRPSTYSAYWHAIKNGIGSGLNGNRRRRRRSPEGKIVRRDTERKNKGGSHIVWEGHEVAKDWVEKGESYARFVEKATGHVMIANFKLGGKTEERMHYEFAKNGQTFDTEAEAIAEKKRLMKIAEERFGKDSGIWKALNKSKQRKTQKGFDSSEILHRFKTEAMKYIRNHVEEMNPVRKSGESRTGEENKPFFMYMGIRAPHSPYSHNLTQEEIEDFLPYAIHGKPGEQIGLLDRYIGEIMRTLHELDIADNTMVIFTADNGPDSGAFKMFNHLGHIRTGTMRGKKAAVYEGWSLLNFYFRTALWR